MLANEKINIATDYLYYSFSSYGVLYVYANESKELHSETLEYVNGELEINEKVERKIICDATLEDDFEDDSVIVIFKNSKSRKLESHNTKSFPEVTATSVEDLTQHYKTRNDKQRNTSEQLEDTLSPETSATNDEMYVDENKFHQIVKINLKSKSKENVLKCIKQLEARDDILMVFPNYIYESALTANDTEYEDGNDWAIEKINLPAAWNITTGSSSVKIGIIDSGIDATNPDLSTRVSTTLGECFTGVGTKLTDEGGHGTAVAGIAGAHGNNSKGVTGVCWNVTLVSLKAAVKSGNACTMSYENFAKAVKYATENNIPILNYSYNGIYNREEVVIALGNYSGLLVCAAGNEAKDISNDDSYSIDCDNMIVVTDTNKDDELYTYKDSNGKTKGSNYSATKVDLAAPGKDIGTTSISSSHYTTTGGTSIAAPFVAGVAALLKSKYPGMDAQALKYYIENNVDVIPELAGKVKTGGRLNAYKALSNLETFTVKYDANGGGGSPMADTTVIYGCSTPLSKNTYSRAGYAFKGWNIERADSGLWYYIKGTDKRWFKEGEQDPGYVKHTYKDETKVLRTTTNGKTVIMHAKWEEKINIEFLGNDATGGSADPMMIVTGETKYLPSVSAFERDGFTPKHWYAKNSDGEHYYTNGTTEGWYAVGSKPSGYTRVDFSGGPITTEDIISSEYGETIYMCAYWEPDFGVLGDADMSGKISVADATLIQKYISGQSATYPDDERWLLLADVDFDGNVTISDATLINKYIAKTIDEFGS